MKRIICAALACILLCACTAAPSLREGCYLFSLEDTGGPAMVMCYTYDGVIEAESIAFRLLEGENENE